MRVRVALLERDGGGLTVGGLPWDKLLGFPFFFLETAMHALVLLSLDLTLKLHGLTISRDDLSVLIILHFGQYQFLNVQTPLSIAN